MAEAQPPLHYTWHRPPSSLYLQPAALQRHVLDEQVELWWSRDPRRSLSCYCASVLLIVGLGLGGVGLLSTTTTSLSGEWRLGMGTTLCLLALAVLLKQLLSSAVQDMNCVHSRRRIEQLKSGGRADPALILTVGVAVVVCGAVLLCVATAGGDRGHQDGGEMLVSALVLMGAGAAMALAVVAYSVLDYAKRQREQRRRRRMMRVSRARRAGGEQAVRVFSVSGGQVRREMFSSRTSLI